MKELVKDLKNKILVSDGAMGTSLQEKGLSDEEVPEEWNVSKPELVKDVHKSYIDAGADLIITNTFGGSGFKLERKNLINKVNYFNKKAAELALEVAQDKVYVFGDIGPSGRFVKPYGDIEPQDMYKNFREQVLALRDTGINGFILETFSDINELQACIKAVKKNTDLLVISSMTFQKTLNSGYKTIMGVSVRDMIEKCLDADSFIIGTNCGNGSKEMLDIVKEFSEERKEYDEDFFVIAQPNAGMPVVKDDRTIFNETPEDFKEIIPEYLDAGVNIIGGCCGTTPEHIKVIKEIVASATNIGG